MQLAMPAGAGEFLEHYARDVPSRWSADDLADQQAFVTRHLAETSWLDWSAPTAALQLLQAAMLGTALGEPHKQRAVLLAGPVVELLPPEILFTQAASVLRSGGRLVTIIPCLRDNSPESQLFAEITSAEGWPYRTAEEVIESLGEAGFKLQPDSGFVAVPRFVQSALADRLAFTGYRRWLGTLQEQGYDPVEVGWGELRAVAQCE